MSVTEIQRLLSLGEGQHVEFKSCLSNVDAIGHVVCGLLNTSGGYVVCGVDNDGHNRVGHGECMTFVVDVRLTVNRGLESTKPQKEVRAL